MSNGVCSRGINVFTPVSFRGIYVCLGYFPNSATVSLFIAFFAAGDVSSRKIMDGYPSVVRV